MAQQTLQVKTSDLVSEFQLQSRDTSTATLNKFKLRFQHYYTFLLGECNNYIAEKTKYGNLKATQRSYLLFPDFIVMKTIRIYDGSNYRPCTEVKSVDRWHELTRTTRTSTVPEFWITFNEEGNYHLELDGIPASDVNRGIEMVYEGYQPPLSFPDDYVTGTVSVEQGSEIVTGSGTTWTSAMVGRFINVGKWWYEILSVESTTSLTLVNYYQEDDASGAAYTIAELLRLPPEHGYTPLWGTLKDFWRIENPKLAATYKNDYESDLLIMRDKYKAKSTGSVTPGRRVSGYRTTVPRNYPSSRIG